MQKKFEEERVGFKNKIKSLEDIIFQKEQEIEELKEKLVASKKKKDNTEIIDRLNMEKELIQKELEVKITEFKSALINNSTLNNQLELEKQTTMQLHLELKLLNEKLKNAEQKCEDLQKTTNNQIFFFEKEIEEQKKDILNYQTELENKNISIDYLNNQIKDLRVTENNYKSSLNFFNELREKEELLKKEKEELKNEREKFNEEIIRKKNEEKKKSELEKIMKQEEEAKEKVVEIKSQNFEGYEKIISDLLSEFLIKLNNFQYYISVFDLLDKSLKHYDELKYINNLNSLKNESVNDILYNFYETLKSYFIIQGEKATLNDFLLQKPFRFTEFGKEDIEIVKKINSIKLSEDIIMIDIYRKKRELFFKSKEFIFNTLKERFLGENKKQTNNNQNEFLQITKPPLELDINLDEIMKNNFILVKYQVYNVFNKLRELTIHISNMPMIILYSLIINSQKLNSLKIIFIKSQSEQQNNINIENLNNICPIMINHLKKLNSFSLVNLPISSNKLSSLVESLKASKVKKLTLSKCLTKKEDISIIIPYFSQNTLSEIDLSNHNYHIPFALNNSLLNYNVNNQLTSICFNNCQLNEDDIKSITNYIVSSTSLLVCDIGKNILSPLACSTFGYCILKTTSLETLRINECGINGESLLFIFNGKGSKPLKHVNLNGNEFGDIGLVSISAFMKNSPLLESIELEKCGGTDMGFISLANMIQGNTNSKIKYVNFHKNNVTFASLGILKKFNDVFTSRKVVFALDKMEGNIDIDCAIFT
jgi:hypothetical protein